MKTLLILVSLLSVNAFAGPATRKMAVKEVRSPIPEQHSSPSQATCKRWADTFFNVSADNSAYCDKTYNIKVQSI